MTLYETAFWTKKASYGFVIFIVILIGFAVGRLFVEKVTLIINRPAAEAPQNGFGAISHAIIRSNISLNYSPSFTVETVSSLLPTFQEYNNIVNVYKLEEKPRNLESDDLTRSIATKLGFKTEPKITNDIIYFWNEDNKILTYNRQYSVFQYVSNATVQTQGFSPFNLNDSQAAASDIFSRSGVILNSNENIIYKFTGEYVDYDVKTKTALKSALGDRADYVRLNAVRSVIAKPSVTTKVDILDNDRNTSLVSIVLRNSGNTDLKNIALINYYNWNIDPTKGQTYRIISTADAYQALNTAKKTLISAKFAKDSTVASESVISSISSVRVLDVRLGYYESSIVQPFIQPAYEFRCEGTTNDGDNVDLLYYVPALP